MAREERLQKALRRINSAIIHVRGAAKEIPIEDVRYILRCLKHARDKTQMYIEQPNVEH